MMNNFNIESKYDVKWNENGKKSDNYIDYSFTYKDKYFMTLTVDFTNSKKLYNVITDSYEGETTAIITFKCIEMDFSADRWDKDWIDKKSKVIAEQSFSKNRPVEIVYRNSEDVKGCVKYIIDDIIDYIETDFCQVNVI